MRPIVLSLLALATLAACSDDGQGPHRTPATGVVVLNGVGATGLTTVALDDSATAHIDLDPFDGTALTLRGDTVLTTASSFSGDLLYVTDLRTSSVRTLQMPGGSNPAGAEFASGDFAGPGGTAYAVALRNSGTVRLVRITGGGADVTDIAGFGDCPYDVGFGGARMWVLVANQRCSSDFKVLGRATLAGVLASGGEPSNITLPTSIVAPTRLFVIGDEAYVFGTGCNAAFTTGCTSAPAAIAKVNLAVRTVPQVLAMPAGSYGLSFDLGRDGRLYATTYSPSGPDYSTWVIDPATLSFVGPFAPGSEAHHLEGENDLEQSCFAATANSDGTIACLANGQTASVVHLYAPDGTRLRSLDAGSPAFDLALR